MVTVEKFGKVEGGKFRGGGKGVRQGSKKFVTLSDGSTVKWWKGTWRFSKPRWESRVATSLNFRAMTVAEENGRWVKDVERYDTFEKFMARMVKVVGPYEFLRIVEWIKS